MRISPHSLVLFLSLLQWELKGGVSKSQPLCECMRLGQRGASLVGQSQFRQAEAAFKEALAAARHERHTERIAKSLNNIGGANLYSLNYDEALSYFAQAREAASRSGLAEVEASVWLNMASMYMMLGSGDAAEQATGEAIRLMPAASPYVPLLLSQQVRMVARRGDFQRATSLWSEAMTVAQKGGAIQVECDLWATLAIIRQAEGDLNAADDALANAFRLARLHRLPDPGFLHTRIGRLRLAQNRPEEALRWFEMAASQRLTTRTPAVPWAGKQNRAATLLALGRRAEALTAYRQAWGLALDWRQDVLPAQSTELAADVSMAELAANYAALALSGQASRRSPARITEAWAAIEQSRAAGLRRQAMQRAATLRNLGPEYRSLLSSMRRAVVKGSPIPAARIGARLAELEARAGLASRYENRTATARPSEIMRQIQAGLANDQALFTFHLSEPRSFAWSLTSDGIFFATLPRRAALSAAIVRFRQSVRENTPDLYLQARELHDILFAPLPAAARSRSKWLISQDDLLFQLPLPALRDSSLPGAPYLVESHTLQTIPSALWILHSVPDPPSNRMLAVGNAIHNGADPRLKLARPTFAPLSFWVWPWRRSRPAPLDTLELPTLAGSRVEVETVAGIWRQAGRPASVLSAAEASQERVESALHGGYSTLHFATHIVHAPAHTGSFLIHQKPSQLTRNSSISVLTPSDPFLTLSINREGHREGLNAGILAAHDVPGALVVLNGCNSGLGITQAGAGLSGFTSAWLAAGARSIIASLWPIEDDQGEIFVSFYQKLLSRHTPSEALRLAQLELIRSASAVSQPRRWATYFSIGKE